MIEKVMLDYLNQELTAVCYMERPAALPVSYVLIQKTGGSQTDKISRSTLAIQSYGETLYAAAVLNEAVKAAVLRSVELGAVSGVKLNSDYNFTNPATKEYRYQAVFDVAHY